jgi:hypothetical protein
MSYALIIKLLLSHVGANESEVWRGHALLLSHLAPDLS